MRPLAWRLYLPAAATGLLLGEVAAGMDNAWAGRVVVAGLLVAPAGVRNRRARLTAALVAAVAAVLGLFLGERQRALESRLLEAPGLPSAPFQGWIEALRPVDGFGSKQALRLDVRLEGPASPGPGAGRLRLNVWSVSRVFEIGDLVRGVADLRRPRGLCNRGRDGQAVRALGGGVDWWADLADDRALVRVGQTSSLSSLLARSRAHVARAIDARLEPATASVLRALVVGDARGLPEALRVAYARTGTTHVLSVSGLHLAIVAGSAFWAFRQGFARWTWLAQRIPSQVLAATAAIPAAALYASFSGAAVATVRSMVMASVFLLGTVLGRAANLEVAVAAAALVICLRDPSAPFDASFQLSFGAVLSIVLGVERLKGGALGRHLTPGSSPSALARSRIVVSTAIAVTVAASLGTAPLTAAHFGSVAALGSLANLVVVPLVGWIALLAGLAGAAVEPLAPIACDASFAIAAWAIRTSAVIVEAMADLPGAALAVDSPGLVGALGWYAGLASLLVGKGMRLPLCSLGLALVLVDSGFLGWGRPPLRLVLFDVGQGDAILVETPARRAIVVDAGTSSRTFDPGAHLLVRVLRAAGAPEVSVVALSHPQSDHDAGLASLVEARPPLEFWSSGLTAHTASFAALDRALSRHGVRRRDLVAGAQPGRAWRDVGIDVLHPGIPFRARSKNDQSLVLALRYGSFRAVLAGDVETAAERRMGARGVDLGCSVLKVPHHGSRTSSSEPFLAATRPALALAGIGSRNRFGFPSTEVRRRLARYSSLWRDTARSGEIIVESDGQIATVSTCRADGD